MRELDFWFMPRTVCSPSDRIAKEPVRLPLDATGTKKNREFLGLKSEETQIP